MNLYVMKRFCRIHDRACIVRSYRKIAVEKKRLYQTGVPYIEVHLWCRHLTNVRNRNALARLQNYYAQKQLFPLEPVAESLPIKDA